MQANDTTAATHTPRPWRVGKAGGIVADAPIDGGVQGTEDTAFYGGYLICETVAPCNRALIAAAPDLLAALEAIATGFNMMLANRLPAEEIVAKLDSLIDEHSAAIAQAREVAS